MVSIDGQVESAGYWGDRFDVRDVFDLRYGVMNACLDVREDVARLVGFGHFFSQACGGGSGSISQSCYQRMLAMVTPEPSRLKTNLSGLQVE